MRRSDVVLVGVGRAARVVAVGCLTVYALIVLVRPGIAPQTLTDVPYNAALVAAVVAAACWASTARVDRFAWSVLALALAVWTAGDFAWMLVVRSDSPPFPSWADAGWLAFYLPAYVGCVALLGGRAREVPLSSWLDGLVGGLVAGALGALALPTILADVGGEPVAVATTLAYPLADLLLIGLVAFALVLCGRQASRPWLLLGLGLVVFAISDSAYLLRIATDTYVENTVLDVGWPLGVVLMGLAPSTSRSADRSRLTPPSATAVPVVGALVAIALLAYATMAVVGPAAVVLATLAALSAVARLLLTLREVRRLADSRRLALTDDLTGLANRRSFYAQAERQLADPHGHGITAALLLFDLDRFKELNDTLGHQAGDELLHQLADRLRAALPDVSVLARLGGDEFVALLDGGGAAHALEAAEAVRGALEQPFALDGMLTHVTASIGVALAPQHGSARTELLRHADVAMYRAKQRGTGVELYTREGDVHTRDRLQLAGDLRRALDGDELVLHFQPKGDLATGEIAGVEALARWQHPERGLLYPDAFIEVAEQHGLMRPLTLRVLALAARQRRAWSRAGLQLSVAVNVSAANLLDARFPADVAELLERHEVPPRALQLEITENTIMVDPTRALDVLARLGELGVTFALDDFGTGYSSLAYLKKLPVDELKIDKSFVMDMTTDADDATIVRSTVELARNLGLRVVAEGVETAERWSELTSFGCHTAQGYYLSRPLPAGQLTHWLTRRPALRSEAA